MDSGTFWLFIFLVVAGAVGIAIVYGVLHAYLIVLYFMAGATFASWLA